VTENELHPAKVNLVLLESKIQGEAHADCPEEKHETHRKKDREYLLNPSSPLSESLSCTGGSLLSCPMKPCGEDGIGRNKCVLTTAMLSSLLRSRLEDLSQDLRDCSPFHHCKCSLIKNPEQ
jgi:hypothetical protein